MLDPNDRSRYLNYTGTGNTVNCNHPAVRRMILECLRYWVGVMHFAEAWDAAGLYQVGGFPVEQWAEWNGRYRDDLRKFIRGDAGITGAAHRGWPEVPISTSISPALLIRASTLLPATTGLRSTISFLTIRSTTWPTAKVAEMDRMTISANYGIEDLTQDQQIDSLRLRQIKNFAAILLLSQGTPMLLAGDEFRRTQRGNNNAYCQDNEISWIDWTLLEKHRELFRFFKLVLKFRQSHPALRRRHYFYGEKDRRGRPEIVWHGVQLEHPDWSYESLLFVHLIRLRSRRRYPRDDQRLHQSSPLSNSHNCPVRVLAPSGRYVVAIAGRHRRGGRGTRCKRQSTNWRPGRLPF
jgi:isoamylase